MARCSNHSHSLGLRSRAEDLHEEEEAVVEVEDAEGRILAVRAQELLTRTQLKLNLSHKFRLKSNPKALLYLATVGIGEVVHAEGDKATEEPPQAQLPAHARKSQPGQALAEHSVVI